MHYQRTVLLMIIFVTKLHLSIADSDGNANLASSVRGGKIIIRKCCAYGQGVYSGKGCQNMTEHFNLTAWSGNNVEASKLDVQHSHPSCPENVTTVSVYPTFKKYSLTANGELEIILDTLNDPAYHAPDQFCLDNYVKDDKPAIITAIICNIVKPSRINYTLNAYCMLVSCFFILLTVAVYLSLPKMLCNLPGKVLIAYLLSFFVTFLAVTLLILIPKQLSRFTCNVFTFVIYFSMLAAFSWMNVMCYDIWNTFRDNTISRNTSSRSRFSWYCVYAFGVPTALSAMLAVCEFTDIPVPIKPRLEVQKCFFEGHVRLLYLHIPIFILCIGNILMFVLTAIKMEVERNRINSQDSRVHNRNERRFWLYVKLFTVMGISWIFEVVGAFYRESVVPWQVIDVYNLLVGFVIFVMFVCKKKIYLKIMDRYKWAKRFTSFTTRTTMISSLSTPPSRSTSKDDAAKNKDIEIPFINGDRKLNNADNYM